jgi:hypothetical protein
MATDLSSGENGSVSADRISAIGSTIGTAVGSIPAVEPVSTSGPAEANGLTPAPGHHSGASPEQGATTPIVVSAETRAKAEAAARIAAQSLGAPNLTKELAQLLAASFAQSQMMLPEGLPSNASPAAAQAAAPPPPFNANAAGTPTNAELASLSAIMAGTQSVRRPLPRFRDELATLNYARPQAPGEPDAMQQAMPAAVTRAIVAPAAHAQPAGQMPQLRQAALVPYPQTVAATFDAHHDDEPMPIPSTWREKSSHDEDRSFARQLGAAVMGLAAGLVVVVPVVLWLTGVIGPQAKRTDTIASRASERPLPKIRPIEPPTDSATFYSSETPGGAASDPGPVTTTASMARVTAPAPVDASQQIEQVLVLARQKIDGGDVAGARDLLSGEDGGSAAIAFALAETFDPNMLAAWGSRGISADVQRARSLYGRALDMGYGRAMARLDALR